MCRNDSGKKNGWPRRAATGALIGVLTLTPGWPAFAQTQQANRPADGLTLPLAVEIALQSNPLVRATSAGREIASAQTAEARAGRWPSVQISETLTAGNNPVFVFGSLLEQGRFRQSNFDLNALNNPSTLANSRFSISAKLPLFDQWQTATHVKQSQLREQQADAQGAQVQQQIRFEVLRAYYSILLAQAKKEVADEAVKLAEADVKRSRDRVEVGTSVVSDLLAAEVQLADFQQQQIQAEGEIITAQATLNTALGLPLSTPQTIAGQLVERNFDLAPTEELTQTALQQRPDLQRALLAKRTSEVQLKGARNEFLPRADVFTSVGASRNNFVSGSGDYLVGASVTFNLFDAGRNARIKQAQAADRLATSEQEHLANQIRLEVVRSYQQYIAARARLQVAERVISHATEALRIVQDRYNEGLTTITEVLRAETALVRAQTNVLATRYETYVGYASVLLASGRLTDVHAFV
ncbi:MAG: TolC family protein [Acidobacteria bacterium]|nr:TolC family protein [Acidobacteriota bacterium]